MQPHRYALALLAASTWLACDASSSVTRGERPDQDDEWAVSEAGTQTEPRSGSDDEGRSGATRRDAGSQAREGGAPTRPASEDAGAGSRARNVDAAASPERASEAGVDQPDSSVSGAWPPSQLFSNPVIWQDLPDIDILRVDDTFYYTASTMHHSPGAPILRSYDLVNWEFIGHAVPKLDFGAKYDLTDARAYVKGIWASFLNYRKSNKTFYWGGCIEFSKTYIFTAPAAEGPWKQHPPIDNCYYDAGLLIDDDDKLYVAYGNTTISVAELSADGLKQVKTQTVFQTPANIGTLEGSRFYKIEGDYYILLTHPPDSEYVLRSTAGPFGPYTVRPLVRPVRSPVAGSGAPHQGGIVSLQNGDWYYMAFVDAYPGGRIPVLAPVTWNDGWPTAELVAGGWGASYPFPKVPRPTSSTRSSTAPDTFAEATLRPEWEWNHNPDDSKWTAGGKLTLRTASVTSDLYAARNTLTRRTVGPMSTATIELDYSNMKDGDAAGLALFRDSSAWIGVKRVGGSHKVVMVNDLVLESARWSTARSGTEASGQAISGGKIWLRIAADIRPGSRSQARFSYSTDGAQFAPLGPAFTMANAWQFFVGYRYAIFNYATQSLGGSVDVSSFALTTP